MYFNPRSREGSDRGCCMVPMVEVEYFNPRSREGSDVAPDATAAMREISIHAPVKGATSSEPHTPDHTCDFNPRSREGSTRYGHSQ